MILDDLRNAYGERKSSRADRRRACFANSEVLSGLRRRAELVLVSVTPSAPPPTVVTIAEAIAAPIIVAVAETEVAHPTTIFPPAPPKLDILRGKGGSPFSTMCC